MANKISNTLHVHRQPLELVRIDQHFTASLCCALATLPQLQAMHSLLHPQEQDYFNTLTVAKRQHSYLLGRYVAKNAIALEYPCASLSEIAIKPGVFSQPIVDYAHLKIKVTLSHSANMGVALTFPEEHPMGIDLEVIEPKNQALIESELTPNEISWILKNPHHSKPTLCTLFWTIKEALSKALLTGMTVPLKIFAIKNTLVFDQFWISEFEHFSQYQALSFTLDNKICSIVYPQRTQLLIDLKAIQQWGFST